MIVAFVLGLGVLLIVAGRSVPSRADHERELRAHVTELLQEKKPENEVDSLLQGVLKFGNAFAQGADVSYIDLLGFEYEQHMFYSKLKDPKKPADEQLVSFGIMGKVFGPKTKEKPAAVTRPPGPLD